MILKFHFTVLRRKCLVLYQSEHTHLIGKSINSRSGAFGERAEKATRTEYHSLQDVGNTADRKIGIVAELNRELAARNGYASINVFASFVHSLSDLIVMIGVLIAAIIIKIRVI